MPKKKPPKNAFYFFMLDFKEEEESRGVRFRGSLKEVAELAGPQWSSLSPVEREPYEVRAAEEKFKAKNDLGNKFTTMGISYAQLEAEEREKRLIEYKMKNEIIGTIQHLNRESTLKTHNFYFVHFNYYCREEDGNYLPCEVAVAQFNLMYGVRAVYHTIIRHERIPTGYSFEALSTSRETHQIPLPEDLKEGEDWKHGTLFHHIKTFLEQDRMSNSDLPPVYAVMDHVDIAQNILTNMAEKRSQHNPVSKVFRVYPLSKLFFYLRNAAHPSGDAFPTEVIAERELEKDLYNFAPGIACSMHENSDTCVHCSKSIVTRWAYLICDHCCADLNIQVVRGKHVPINAAVVELLEESVLQKQQEEEFIKASRRNRPNAKESVSIVKGAGDIKKEGPPAPVSTWGQKRNEYCDENAQNLPTNPASGPVREPGNPWGMAESTPLRKPKTLPSSINAPPNFTEADFPGLGSRNSKPSVAAAVAGRGRGRARIISEAVALGEPRELLNDAPNCFFGRGKPVQDGKPGSRIAANLQGLKLN